MSARNEFLSVMTWMGVHLDPTEYTKIVTPSVRLGLGAATDGDPYAKGVSLIRDALVDAARDVVQPNHHVIVEVLLGWLADISIESQKAGLYHSLRLLLNALMANPECDDNDAPQLAAVLGRINELQRAKAAEAVVEESPQPEILSTQGR